LDSRHLQAALTKRKEKGRPNLMLLKAFDATRSSTETWSTVPPCWRTAAAMQAPFAVKE